MMRDFSGSRPWESIASSRAGLKRDCPIKKFYVVALSALTRSTRFCSADEFTADSCQPRSASCSLIRRSIQILAEARIYFVWRADRADRNYADGAGGKEGVDQSVAVFAR